MPATSSMGHPSPPAKWTTYQLYVILDVYSRYVTGWMVAHRESAILGPTTTTPGNTPILVVFVAAAGLLFGLHRFRGPHRGLRSDGPRLTR